MGRFVRRRVGDIEQDRRFQRLVAALGPNALLRMDAARRWHRRKTAEWMLKRRLQDLRNSKLS